MNLQPGGFQRQLQVSRRFLAPLRESYNHTLWQWLVDIKQLLAARLKQIGAWQLGRTTFLVCSGTGLAQILPHVTWFP